MGETQMQTLQRGWLMVSLIGSLVGFQVLGDDLPRPDNGRVDQQPPVGLFDNLYLNAGVGVERPPGEDSTGFATIGANWGIPLTPPDGVALGLQLGGSLKARDDDPEWNATFGGFSRHFPTFPDQQGAFGALFDYRRTAFHNDLWAFRPIIGTTINSKDALGI